MSGNAQCVALRRLVGGFAALAFAIGLVPALGTLMLAGALTGVARADDKAAAASSDLANAIRAGDLDAVKSAVEAGADLNALDEKKMPPLGLAALLGKTDIVDYLAEKGADVNRNDGSGFTPLMCAAIRGQSGAVWN